MNVNDRETIINEVIGRINKPKKVYVEVCKKDVELPEYKHIGDGGMDIRASIDVKLEPNETKIVPTGLKIAVPENYELQIRPRSGFSLKTPLRISNSPGTIDSSYRDEVGIIVTNTSLNESFKIKKGDRIAQLVLCKFEMVEFEKIDDITSIGENRGGGFGSSGIK